MVSIKLDPTFMAFLEGRLVKHLVFHTLNQIRRRASHGVGILCGCTLRTLASTSLELRWYLLVWRKKEKELVSRLFWQNWSIVTPKNSLLSKNCKRFFSHKSSCNAKWFYLRAFPIPEHTWLSKRLIKFIFYIFYFRSYCIPGGVYKVIGTVKWTSQISM